MHVQIPTRGSIIIYFDNNKTPTHAGIVKLFDSLSNSWIIESKWGMLKLFEHKTWAVPASYGNFIQYYGAIPLIKGENYFKEFCQGITKK
jgi:hypothetical protein